MGSESGKLTRRLREIPKPNTTLLSQGKTVFHKKTIIFYPWKKLFSSSRVGLSFHTSTINAVNVKDEVTNLFDGIYEQHHFPTVKSSSKASLSFFLHPWTSMQHLTTYFALTSERFIVPELTIGNTVDFTVNQM